MRYDKIKAGSRTIGGKTIYFRSSWEANYARYLELLKTHGEIADWLGEKEHKTFFNFPIMHGTTRYLPDFKVVNKDGTVEWHEVKGYWYKNSKTKIRRFCKYFPSETLVVVDKKAYLAIAEKAKILCDGWE